MTATLRRIRREDLAQIARFPFTASITEPLTDSTRLQAIFAATGLWTETSGAMAIVYGARLVGTCQFYRAAPWANRRSPLSNFTRIACAAHVVMLRACP